MTQHGDEETRVRGGRGQRSVDKTNPPRYRKDEEERGSSSASNRRGGSGSVRPSKGASSSSSRRLQEQEQMMHEDAHSNHNNVGEVDYTDGEMGSASSTISASSPHSSVGSGGGGRRAGGGGSAGGSSGNGSTHKVRNKNNEPSPGSAPSPSSSSGRGAANGRTGNDNGVAPIPGVTARPAGVPFGASALSKTMPNNGRGRPRGLRPRSSGSGTPGSGRFGSQQRVPSFSAVPAASLGRQASSGSMSGAGGGKNSHRASSRGAPGETAFQAAEATAAKTLAPGVPVEDAVRAAIKIESVMRVLIARGYVRRKLVSEVTAFSLIMERGIEVIKVGVRCLCVC